MVAVVWQYCDTGFQMYQPPLKFGGKSVYTKVANNSKLPG